VAGAINIPYGEIYKAENLAKLDKSKKIVVICYTGHTASQVTRLLNQLGYDAYAMKFGMMGWTSDENVLNTKPFTKAPDYELETTVNEAQAVFDLPEISTGKEAAEDIILAQTEAYLTSGNGPTIPAQEVYEKAVVAKDPSYQILSIRKPEDYAKGHVPGAINIPYSDTANEENLKKLDPSKKIVVVCYTGHTASQTTIFLNQLGYDAYAMKFGMMGWTSDENALATTPFAKAADYPTVAGENP
jgi:rhodanese-related sulfurtransferase